MSVLSLSRSRMEPIRLVSRRHNYFPQAFVWRGHRYNVHTVEEAWTRTKRKKAWHYFRVRCSEGIFDITQDLSLNAWYLAKKVK